MELENKYPHIAKWVKKFGRIEIGYDYMCTSFLKAINEGGVVWETDRDDLTLDEAMNALEKGIADWLQEMGLN